MGYTEFQMLAGHAGNSLRQALDTIQTISGMFGKGRKEADIIVPRQEEYGRLLIAANDALDYGGMTVEELLAIAREVAGGWREFENFTRDPAFTDGRASLQARQTIRPLVDGLIEDSLGQLGVSRADGGTLGRISRELSLQGYQGVATVNGIEGPGQAAGPSPVVVLGVAGVALKVGGVI